MKRLTNRFDVDFSYDVVFGRDVFDPGNRLLRDSMLELVGEHRPIRVLVTVDAGLSAAQPTLNSRVESWFDANSDLLELAAEPLVISGGEAAKNDFATTLQVIRAAREAHLARDSFVFAIGGGAFLDAAGFATSLVHRGVRLVRFPSTVLSQNDSGVGVKNGVNLRGVKNFLGVFSPPALVVNDLSLLRTLADRDWVAGVAEAFKVAIIKDRAFLEWLIENAERFPERDEAAMEPLIRRCAELHVEHIQTAGDPFEFGSARPLDFGHWLGHKLESLSVNELRHGEAVAIGMCVDLFIAADLGFIGSAEAEWVIAGLSRSGLPIWDDILIMTDGAGLRLVVNGIEEFREHLGGRLYLTLPKPLGQRLEINELTDAQVRRAIERLREIRCLGEGVELNGSWL